MKDVYSYAYSAPVALSGATRGIRSSGGHLLLWLLCFHLLAQETGTDARSYLLQRADQQGRGDGN